MSQRNRRCIWASLHLFLFLSTAASAAPPLTDARAKALTETLLLQLEQHQFAKALKLMSPLVQKALRPRHLKEQAMRNQRVLGPYRKGSLTLISRLAIQEQTRFVWRAQFKRESCLVLLLFDETHHMIGFVIQSPALLRDQQKEQPTTQPAPPQMKQINLIVDALMNGYNQNKWALFCRYCSPVMQQVFAPKKFAPLRQYLHSRYGRYLSRRWFETRTLAALRKTLIIRYKANFSKQKDVIVQFVLQPTTQGYRVAGWRIK